MRFRHALLSLMLLLLLGSTLARVHAQAAATGRLEALCVPGVDPRDQLSCERAGPSSILAELERMGMAFPEIPLPVKPADSNLAKIPYLYAKLNTDRTPAFSFLPSSFSDNPTRYIDSGFKYISYQSVNETDIGKFFLSRNGDWIDGNYIARASIPTFQGVEVTGILRHGFGWIIDAAQSRTQPGFDAPFTGKSYRRFDFVNVFQTQKIADTDWTMIAPDEWIEKRNVARVLPESTPPQGVTAGRWISINLYDQTLAVYENYQVVFATLVSTGIDPFFTQPGLFQIYEIKEKDTMSGAFAADRSDYYYLEDVPFTLYYDQARAIHGAYWHSIFGYERSHGCVNLSVGDAHWVYNWAKVGDWVYVWDSSGRTPTDPDYYTQGGA